MYIRKARIQSYYNMARLKTGLVPLYWRISDKKGFGQTFYKEDCRFKRV